MQQSSRNNQQKSNNDFNRGLNHNEASKEHFIIDRVTPHTRHPVTHEPQMGGTLDGGILYRESHYGGLRPFNTSAQTTSSRSGNIPVLVFSDDGTQEIDESRQMSRLERAFPEQRRTLTTDSVWDDQIQGESTEIQGESTENQPEEPVSGGKVEMDPLEAELSMTNQKTMQELTAQTKRLQLKEPVITKQALIEKEQSDDDGNEGCSFTVYRTCNIQ